MMLSIVIVSYNARADLERCLQSLVTNPPALAHDIVVVDNDSSDGAAEVVGRGFPTVRLLRAGANLGFGRANNLGIRHSSAEFVLLLNPDTVVPAGAIDRLCVRMSERTDAAAIGPRLVDAEGRAEVSWGPFPGLLAEAWQKAVGWLYSRGTPWVTQRIDMLSRQERAVDWVSGACLLLRRAEADAAGLFDERYFLYWEDADLCAALRQHGRTVLFSPVAEVVHARGRSGAGAGAQVRAHYRRGQLAFYAKHHPGSVWLLRLYLRLSRQLPGGAAGL
jgi:GT2 family glycosyltransferase